MNKEELNNLGGEIITAALEVHKHLGPGMLESVYVECLMKEFELRNIHAEREVNIPLFYKGLSLPRHFSIDILVEREIIIEAKSIAALLPVHSAKLLNHLKLTGKSLGYLIDFNVPKIKDGIKRMVNDF